MKKSKKAKTVKLRKFKGVEPETLVNLTRIDVVQFLPGDLVLITFKSRETVVIPKHVWETLPVEIEGEE